MSTKKLWLFIEIEPLLLTRSGTSLKNFLSPSREKAKISTKRN